MPNDSESDQKLLVVTHKGDPGTTGSDSDPGGDTGEAKRPAVPRWALGKGWRSWTSGGPLPEARTAAAQDRGLGGESPCTPRNPSSTSAVHTPPPNRARAAPWPSSAKPLLTAALIPGPNWPSTPAWTPA
ncbi:uncharacterized protein [Physeter macrocephalus]|uniref:Uncharacterized protein isoform X2 n=1 Tax=Physeter macrocephalus TaxID=9755 RepID=A0A9W2X3M4_PHYMC|nr:uncharacterized protein LOC114487546 isoform X2 [Physeter catodon]